MGMTFENLTDEELCDLMCGKPEEEPEQEDEEMSEKALMYALKAYEKKLAKLMPKSEYEAFLCEVSIEAFRIEVEELEESEFKQFCKDNFVLITGGANAVKN